MSNVDIVQFVSRSHAEQSFRCLLVTEAMPLDLKVVPSVDKSTGQKTRVGFNSAVVLEKASFNMQFKSRDVLDEVLEPVGSTPANIETVLYEL